MEEKPLRALCWIDDADTCRVLATVLRRCGFEVVGEVTSVADALVAAGVCQPHAVVVDVALTGDLGLGAVRAVHAVAPPCAVLVISPFETMKSAAMEAGAYDVLGYSDLRVLEHSLKRLATEAQATLEAAPSTARGRRGTRRTNAPAS